MLCRVRRLQIGYEQLYDKRQHEKLMSYWIKTPCNISNTVAKDRNTGVSIGVLGEKQSLNLGLKIDQLKVIYGKVTVVTGRIIEIESFAKRFGCVAFTCEL